MTWLPITALAPILVWIGVDMCAEGFTADAVLFFSSFALAESTICLAVYHREVVDRIRSILLVWLLGYFLRSLLSQ